VSGSADNDGINEVSEICKFLVAAGVPASKIARDESGTRTLRTMTNYNRANPVVIVTDRYHIHRAVFLARSGGLNATGYTPPAEKMTPTYLWCGLRETASRCRAVLDYILLYFRHDG
jgi:SanA protein